MCDKTCKRYFALHMTLHPGKAFERPSSSKVEEIELKNAVKILGTTTTFNHETRNYLKDD